MTIPNLTSIGRICKAALLSSAMFLPLFTPAAKAQNAAVAEQTSFDAVTAHLDPGGSLYGYLSLEHWLSNLNEKVDDFRALIQGFAEINGSEEEEIDQIFGVIEDVIERTGIESVTGAGLSGIAIGDGLYRTKMFIHKKPGSESSGIWSMFGNDAHELSQLEWLSADAVWAQFSDLNPGMIWNALNEIAREHEIEEMIQGLDQAAAQFEAISGTSLEEVINSLAGEMGGYLTLSQTKMISLPNDNGSDIEIPEPGIVLALKVRDRTIFDIADRLLENNSAASSFEENEVEYRVLPLPFPLPVEVKLAIAQRGDYLFVASNDALIKELVAVESGETQALKDSEEFLILSAGMPTEGNSFSFISGRFNQVFQEVLTQILAQSGDVAASSLMSRIMEVDSAAGFGVGQNLSDGLYSVTTGNQRPEQIVLAPLVIAPVAISASMLLPALSKAKEKAQSVKCMNNMKQIVLASYMYADVHDARFPDSLLETRDYLPVPAILFCPISPESSSAGQLTWENLDMESISYEYSGQGLSMTALPNPAQTVILRCKFHNHVGHADGSVMASQENF